MSSKSSRSSKGAQEGGKSIAETTELTNLPLKLHALLEDAENRGLTSVVSWENNGKAFKVHDKERFVKEIMPNFFSTSNYQSFQRNCNLWGFRTASKGPSKGECSHAMFIRGNLNACRKMRVIRNKTFPDAPTYSSSATTGTSYSTPGTVDASDVATQPPSSMNQPSFSTGMNQTAMSGNLSQGQVVTNNLDANAMISTLAAAILGGNNETALSTFSMQQQPQQQLINSLAAVLPSMNLGALNQQQQQQQPQAQDLLALLSGAAGGSTLPGGLQQPQQQMPQQSLPQSNALPMTALGSTRSSSPPDNSMCTTTSNNESEEEEDFNTLIVKAKAIREAALKSGARVLACRARGMPMNHSANTAFFIIDDTTDHGSDLVCSHPTCRNGGIKFVFCKYCDVPIAKRSFRVQHAHSDLQAAEAKSALSEASSSQGDARTPSAEPGTRNSRDENVDEDTQKFPARKRQRVQVDESDQMTAAAAPLDTLAVAAAAEVATVGAKSFPGAYTGKSNEDPSAFRIASGSSETCSSFSGSSENRPRDGESNDSSSRDGQNQDPAVGADSRNGEDGSEDLREEWLRLLEARRRVDTANDMSTWLMRVFAVSERCASQQNNSISEDDQST